MINDSGARHRSRALVLGGGGPVGLAWEIGLVDGFASQGITLGPPILSSAPLLAQ